MPGNASCTFWFRPFAGVAGFLLAAVAASPYAGLLGICIGAAGIWIVPLRD